jgi:U6 snRNA-associated Sm-like protein LSm7
MSERGQQRGGGRGEYRGRGGRGGAGGGRGGGGAQGERERPKKENILDLGKYMDKKITVKFTGGREGTTSFDPLSCAKEMRMAELGREMERTAE